MRRLRHLVRFWFTFETAVSRGTYLRHGLALAALKYAGDATIVHAATGEWWTPLDYLRSVSFHLSLTFRDGPWYVLPALSLWALPFVWIGVTMTVRRALDAGHSAWLALVFFVPYVNYVLMAVLAAVPSAEPRQARREEPEPGDRRLPGALMAMGAGLVIGLAMLHTSVMLLGSYGLSLFVGTPVVIGAITAFLFNRGFRATARETNEVVLMTIALVGGAAFLLGHEGAICLLMAFPLGIGLGLLGGVVGRAVVVLGSRRLSHAAIVVMALPATAVLEGEPTAMRAREVRSSIEIAASPERVWASVLAFPPLAEPAEPWFRAGIAYPVSARIDGEGVGAIRYCEFSTGAFVEPITHWEPGRLLAFDVSASPRPLREWTFRADVAPPHLDDFLRPVRGEFRLIPLPDGRTRLEGSTWYDLRIRPAGYWALFSDWLIGSIHDRVLEHIKRNAEDGGLARQGTIMGGSTRGH